MIRAIQVLRIHLLELEKVAMVLIIDTLTTIFICLHTILNMATVVTITTMANMTTIFLFSW